MTRFALLAPAALVAWTTACGPSMKNLVESDMRFEHCYRIDEDPSTPLEHKQACWREWSTHYAKGQDRSRVIYAKDRAKVLHGALASGPPPAAPVACPTPANPYAPPPSVTPKDEKSAAAPGTATLCSETCTKAWRACSTPCGTESGCMITCDSKFRECVKACL
jgi:hypothetical protein